MDYEVHMTLTFKVNCDSKLSAIQEGTVQASNLADSAIANYDLELTAVEVYEE